MQRGHTRDPWPCCDRPADDTVGRPKERICEACRNLIRTGEDALERQKNVGEQRYRWPEVRHMWPQYYGDYEFGTTDTREDLGTAMFNLVTALATRAHERQWKRKHQPVLDCANTHTRYLDTVEVMLNAKTRELLNKLDVAIRAALTQGYAEGKARGRSTLLQLANGELSMNDFDKGAR